MASVLNMTLDERIKQMRQGRRGGRGQRRRGGRNEGNAGEQQQRLASDFVGGGRRGRGGQRRGGSQFKSPNDLRVILRNDFARPVAIRREPESRIRVDNLHYDVTREDIVELFGKAGHVLKAFLKYDEAGRSLGTADILFASDEEALRAIDQFNNRILDGLTISVDWAPVPVAHVNPRQQSNRTFVSPGKRSNAGKASVTASPRGGRQGRGGQGRQGRGGGRGRREAKPQRTEAELDAMIDDYQQASQMLQ